MAALVAYMLTANTFFSIAWLAWYESASLTHSYILAETDDGKTYRVPTNYFLGASIRFAQGDFEYVAAPGFPTVTFGVTVRYDVMMRGNACQLPIVDRPTTSYVPELLTFLRLHHQWVIRNVDAQGRIRYNLYPHHIWSNLFQFDDFYALDKRTIRRYRWIIKSECLSVGPNGLEATLRDQRELDIPLPRN